MAPACWYGLGCAACAACCCALLALMCTRTAPLLTLTTRHQFGDWTPLLQLYRTAGAPDGNGTAMLQQALGLAWCAFPAAPGAALPPFCQCVAAAHAAYAEASPNASQAARDAAVLALVGCQGLRPPWRVAPVWSVDPALLTLFTLLFHGCFLYILTGLPRLALWFSLIAPFTVVQYAAPQYNWIWVLSFVTLVLVVEVGLAPALAPPPPALCLWANELLTAPMVAGLAAALHCTRDLYAAFIVCALGATVSGLGARAHLCEGAPFPSARLAALDRISAAAVAAAGLGLLLLVAARYNAASAFAVAHAAAAGAALAVAVALLECLRAPPAWRAPAQLGLVALRSLLLLAAVLADLARA